MHIPFEWAKQRPQFLAEYLSNYFEIFLFTFESYRKKNLRKENVPFPHKRIHTFPLAHKSRLIRNLNRSIVEKALRSSLTGKDVVWITHPNTWSSVKNLISAKQILVYDCMDNVIEFPREKNNRALQKTIMAFEKELLLRANLVLFSSETLKTTLETRYGLGKNRGHVVHNGINPKLLLDIKDTRETSINSPGVMKKLVYVGTISEWFDFELVKHSLERFSNIEIHLYGPSEVQVPHYDRLFYHGPIPHQEVFPILHNADALIMPFKITSLIESVNPVKLYEYVAARRPAIAPYYTESSHFQNFVYLYDTRKDWDELMKKISENHLGSKGDPITALDFCRQNTWKEKAHHINTLLQEVL